MGIYSLYKQIENKEIEETKEILLMRGEDGWGVAHWLSFNSGETKWVTDNKDILVLPDNCKRSVAYWLAENHPTWTTDDPEILSLYYSYKKQTVEDVLVKKGKI